MRRIILFVLILWPFSNIGLNANPPFVALIFPDLVEVEGGTFWMGDDSEWSEADERPVHLVTVRSFEMSQYEIRNFDFDIFLANTQDNGIEKERSDLKPVTNLEISLMIEYCNWLSKQSNYSPAYTKNRAGEYVCDFKSNGFRLPTEAEWEYAARGGKLTEDCLYAGSDDPNEVGWFGTNSKKTLMETGIKKSNELDLYDLSGNAWELCWDGYAPDFYRQSPQNNPVNTDKTPRLVIRGGSSWALADYLRNANRHSAIPVAQEAVGFRVVRTLKK